MVNKHYTMGSQIIGTMILQRGRGGIYLYQWVNSANQFHIEIR